MNTDRNLITDLRDLAEALDGARRYGLTMPFDAAVSGHSIPRIIVKEAADWLEWVDYLDDTDVELVPTPTGDHLWLRGTDASCERLMVTVIVEAGKGVALIEAAKEDATPALPDTSHAAQVGAGR